MDTGASISISPVQSDFVSPLSTPAQASLNQVNGTASVEGEGTICWKVEDINGNQCELPTNGYYVPSATVCLFSPQTYVKEQRKQTCLHLDSHGITLTLADGKLLCFPIGSGNNLPFMLTINSLKQQGQ